MITRCNKLNIFPRRFHKTVALEDSILWEVETPVDKFDLVRLSDANGRVSSVYEDEFVPEPHALTIFDDHSLIGSERTIGSTIVKFDIVNHYDDIARLGSGVMTFVSGGMQASEGQVVVAPGEFVDGPLLATYEGKFSVIEKSEIFTFIPVSELG